MQGKTVSAQNDGLRVVGYAGNNKVLLAMSLDDAKVDEHQNNLAGFAIWRQQQNQPERVLSNRIGFDVGVSRATTAATRKWTPSDSAPFQKFRWVDVPPEGFAAPIAYRVQALYFTGQGPQTRPGPQVTVQVQPLAQSHAHFRTGFTRGYIASQAYADRFHNAPIRPAGPKTPDFDTTPYQAQYAWLGADARKMLFDFIARCEQSQSKVDVFAYDLDEPDVIAAMCRLGKQGRLRAILDNADLHVKKGPVGFPPEVKAAQLVIAAAGAANVRQGKFGRYQHNKVFIQRDAQGTAQRVFLGSMNFSVRGIYVQANNVLVIDDPAVAGQFATAFDVAFANNVAAPPFKKAPISQGYLAGSATDTPDLPKFSFALSPHTSSDTSLDPVSDRIRAAGSSVLFAVMEPNGQGPVLTSLRAIAAKPIVFSYGTVETDSGLAVQSPDGAMGELTSYAALRKNVPAPFVAEFPDTQGKHIHDKFVVVDFNAANPTVFTGSSNLAAGGEQNNGDSLVMIEDQAIAFAYAIEAVALFDHFHFRKAMQRVAKADPLILWYPGKPGKPVPWWREYYDRAHIQMRDRCLFANVPLPPGLQPVKTVDWKALDAEAAAAAVKARTKPSGKKSNGTGKAAGAKPMRRTGGTRKPRRANPGGTRSRGAPARRRR